LVAIVEFPHFTEEKNKQGEGIVSPASWANHYTIQTGRYFKRNLYKPSLYFTVKTQRESSK
jgi:hypothetical protein